MNVPFNAAATARAAIMLGAAGPWRLVELGLVDFPDAARAPQESQRHGAADCQEVMRPNLRHAGPRARLAAVALSGRSALLLSFGCGTANPYRSYLSAEPLARKEPAGLNGGFKSAAGWTSTGNETYETRLENEDSRSIQERGFVVLGVSDSRIPNRHEPGSKA